MEAKIAGEWLVNLYSAEASHRNKDQYLTPLEQTKVDEFFAQHGSSPVFKKYHIEAIRRCLSKEIKPEYGNARELIAKDETKKLFADENDVLQVAINRAKINAGSEQQGMSPAQFNPGLKKMVKLLIDHGAKVNCVDDDGYSPLYYTCVLGDSDLFHYLLHCGADFSTLQKRVVPEQVVKARQASEIPIEDEEIVNLLQVTLDALISPQRVWDMTWVGWPPGVNYNRPLWKMWIGASWGGIIHRLISEGLSYEKNDPGLVMLLHITCYQGDKDEVEEILEYGVPANIPGPRIIDGGQGEGTMFGTAMLAAAAGLQIEVTETLIAHGADPGLKRLCAFDRGASSGEFTPVEIAIAVSDCDSDLLGFLQAFVAKTKDLPDSDYQAALEWCVESDELDFAKDLLERGVRLDQVPLDTKSVKMAQLLTSNGVKLNPKPLQQKALRNKHLDLLRWCVDEYGPRLPSDPVSWGRTGLWLMRNMMYLKEIEYLVNVYPHPHLDEVLFAQIRDSNGEEKRTETNWLHLALTHGNLEAARLLLEAGADPTCPGLCIDAATAMRQVGSWRDIAEELEIIRMIEERLSTDGEWDVPSYAETRAKISEAVEAEGQFIEQRVKKLVESRQEVPRTARKIKDSGADSVIPDSSVYKLLSGSSSFRLLELLPSADRSDPLRGRLVSNDITFQPEYEALSYVWGDIEPAKSITLDGTETSITPNLHSALIHLRSKESVRTIWVDALCINQSFHDERNQQVRIMGDIYKSAKQVIVWLGDAADDSHLVFNQFKDDDSARHEISLEVRRKAWLALLKRPWFYRTWVIQEIALSRRAVVMCGDDTTPWRNVDESWKNDFSGAAKEVAKGGDHPISGIDPGSHVFGLRLLEALSDERDPISILQYSRLCETTEVRDRIYGILGLFEPGFIDVDYNLSVDTIFRQFAEAVINSTGDLRILKHAGLSNHPSWVPDFTESSMKGLPKYVWTAPWRRDAPSHYHYRAPDYTLMSITREDLTSKYLPGLEFSAAGVLTVKGKVVGTIRAMGAELPGGVSHAPGTEGFASVIEEWEKLAETTIPEWKSSDDSVSHAFASTIARDYRDGLYSVDVGFTQWYRHYGTGILEASDPSMFLRDHEFYLWWRSIGKPVSDSDPVDYNLGEFSEKMMVASYNHCLFTTAEGSMGLAGPGAKAGDKIVYFPGSSEPFILRKCEGGRWRLVGDCYLYGLDIDQLFMDEGHPVEDFGIC
ncbi:hypothetical protein NW768_010036 [Fusarium equiseti]|uniref:Heterokaryon incompatibility domain-containing protein n=1 Tax=Fusarium equiseti TaxID=61235 RepID=A0ABQ8R1C8_FUSEQ|nr:hypothetical protein NW768_010036 [Fusarium equiseti]